MTARVLPDFCMVTRPNRRNTAGTILVFLLATMTIVTVLLRSLVRIGEAPGALGSARELSIISEAAALSGVELLTSIASYTATYEGPEFLDKRVRRLTSGTPYSLTNTFGLPTGANSLGYLPPVDFPALKDIAVRDQPTNTATVFDNDIRLPSSTATSLPAPATYSTVPGTSFQYPSGVESAILPNTGFWPQIGDQTYDASGTISPTVSTNLRIKAICKVDTNGTGALPWWGPINDPNALTQTTPLYMPPTRVVVGENPDGPPATPVPLASQKMPAPSLIFVRDLPPIPGTSGRLRAFTYAWNILSESLPASRTYYMTSGRVRVVNLIPGGGESLGSEVMVSYTQIR